VSALFALALADFRERVRRRSFLAVLAAAAWLGLQAIEGRIGVYLGRWTGVPDSAWAGGVMALVGSTFLGVAGFWVVKGSVARDGECGVGQILATTRMRSWTYTLGKALSNFAVLAAMSGVLALAALVFQLLGAGAEPIRIGALLTPIAFVTLPALALVAALAVLFETVRPLAGGFGNLVWFFVWSVLLALSIQVSGFDVFGVRTVEGSMASAVRAVDPEWGGGFVIGSTGADEAVTGRFRWPGLEIDRALWTGRGAVAGVALLAALGAALPFDRFDPARRWQPRGPRRAVAEPEPSEAESAGSRSGAALPALGAGRETRWWSLVRAETWICARALPRWWLAGLPVLAVAGLLAGPGLRPKVLAAAFLWPALAWSGLATRDRRFGVTALLGSAPSPRSRQLPAVVAAGTLIALAASGGVIVRFVAAGEPLRAVAVLAGGVAVALAAVALGILSGGPRLFEGLYVALWYFGPLEGAWPVDFAGTTAASAGRGVPYAAAAVAAGLLVSALAVERRRRAEGGARFA
jgi:hypothetical protein